MELTKEQIEQIANSVHDKLSKEIDRKFVPGQEGTATVVKDETDKLLPTGGFEHFAEFGYAIYKAGPEGRSPNEKLQRWDAVVKVAGLMEEGDMAQGGYLVPEEFRAELLQTTIEAAIVRPKARHIPMATNRVLIPAVVDSTHAAGALFGGVTIYRPGEAGAKTASKPALGRVALTLHKLTGLVYVTDELMEDSPISLQPLLTTMFGEAIAFTEDDDFLNGNGANQALGAFNAANPSLIPVAKENGQPAATIVWENIKKMWARVHPRCQGNAIWIANIECFPELAGMNMAVGTGGVPVWMPAGGASGKPYATLMGAPCILSEKMQALGTQGDIGVADFSQYLIGDKGGIKTAASIHLKFDYDETAFRFVLRYDGQPWWLSALTPRRGSATLSPFVVLADRA